MSRIIDYIDMCRAGWSTDSANNYLKTKRLKGKVYSFPATDLEFYTVIKNSKLFIIFRATENNFMDWADNFKVFPKYGFHGGIINKTAGVFEELLGIVESNPGKTIILLGHSLGGGIARLMNTFLNDLGVVVKEVVTFGAYATTGDSYFTSNVTNYMVTSDLSNLFSMFLRVFGYSDKYIYLKKKGWFSMKNHMLTVYRDLILDIEDKER